MSRRFPGFLFAFLALTTALAFGPALVYANGRATLIASEEKGPYQIEVSILPSIAIVNNTHVSILIRSLSNEQILTDATVTIYATGPATPPTPAASPDPTPSPGPLTPTRLGPIPVPNDIAPQFYETNLPFNAPGEWQVDIQVSSPLGEETIQTIMEVREAGASINWILMAAVVVAILAVGIFTWDRISGRRRRAAPADSETE